FRQQPFGLKVGSGAAPGSGAPGRSAAARRAQSRGTSPSTAPSTRRARAESALGQAVPVQWGGVDQSQAQPDSAAADVITRHRDSDVHVIQIDRHERRNALDIEHCRALQEAVEAATAEAARAIVITGAGTSFCAGADLDAVYGGAFREALYAM